MFKKKEKANKENFTLDNKAKIEEVEKKLQLQMMTMENKKNELFNKVMVARQKGLKTQEEQARGLLRKCLASIRRADSMLMTLELAVESRDLAELNKQFLECIGDLSQNITVSSKKTNAKAAEKSFLKAMYVAGQQTKELDQMLEVGEYAAVASVDGDKYAEFDDEIDSMIQDAENGNISNRNIKKTKI